MFSARLQISLKTCFQKFWETEGCRGALLSFNEEERIGSVQNIDM